LQSILRWTRTYHLWHPRDPSTTESWRKGINIPYFLRRGRLVRCRNGIVKRGINDLAIEMTGGSRAVQRVNEMLRQYGLPVAENAAQSPTPGVQPEVEIVVLPGAARFSTAAEYRLLILLDEARPHRRLLKQANMIVSAAPVAGLTGKQQFAISDLTKALDAIA
jgi:hypothetical protein